METHLNKRTISALLFFTILLAACARPGAGVETTPTLDQAAVDTAVAEMLQATLQAGQPSPTAAGAAEPTATATLAELPQPTPASPYAGLVYRLGDQLFE